MTAARRERKRVKAWLATVPQDDHRIFNPVDGFTVYRYQSETKRKTLNGCLEFVPCTITYDVPKRKARRAGK